MTEAAIADVMVLDFETVNQDVDLQTHGAAAYIQKGMFYAVCCVGEKEGRIHTWTLHNSQCHTDIAEHVEAGGTLAAWNTGFDRLVYAYMVETFDWPPCSNWLDIQAYAAYLNLPASVDGCAQLVFNANKDAEGHTLIKKLNKGTAELDAVALEKIVDYCIQDVKLERALFNVLGPHIPFFEKQAWHVTEDMNLHGIGVDLSLAQNAVHVGERLNELAIEKARHILHDPNLDPTEIRSPTRFRKLLYDCGVDVPDTKWPTLKNLRTNSPEVRELIQARRALSTGIRRKFDRILQRQINGRMYYSFKYARAHTARWSSTGVQLQNLPRGSNKTPQMFSAVRDYDPDSFLHLNFHDLARSHESLAALVRPCLRAAPGHLLAVADYAQIEARIWAYLANDEAALTVYRKGDDPYLDMARHIYGRPADGPTERTVGKVAILGLGYGMGVDKMKETFTAELQAGDVTADDVVRTFRDRYTNLTQLWKQYLNAFQTAVEEQTTCRVDPISFQYDEHALLGPYVRVGLPSGRAIHYWNPRIITAQEGTHIRRSVRYDQLDRSGATRIPKDLHGGLILENIDQALARDLLVHHMLTLREMGIHVAGIVHDEIIAEIPEANAEPTLTTITTTLQEPPHFLPQLPLNATAYLTRNYAKSPIL